MKRQPGFTQLVLLILIVVLGVGGLALMYLVQKQNEVMLVPEVTVSEVKTFPKSPEEVADVKSTSDLNEAEAALNSADFAPLDNALDSNDSDASSF